MFVYTLYTAFQNCPNKADNGIHFYPGTKTTVGMLHFAVNPRVTPTKGSLSYVTRLDGDYIGSFCKWRGSVSARCSYLGEGGGGISSLTAIEMDYPLSYIL